MSPCSPNDVSISLPDGPGGIPVPGFGLPFSLKVPNISPFPAGFPEDLLDILNKLQLLIPSGVLKPALNPNFGKDIFDGIMKLLDMFFPFLMLYKFFLPILNLIICIIEVLCAIPNPFKLIRAMRRLFRNCIPAFLNLFPIFALIIMIISLLLLLLALIEYIIAQILKLVQAILRNINSLILAFKEADQSSVLTIAKKLGALLCVFQNLFVLLSLFNIVIEVIKDMLSMTFAIPPCDDSSSGDLDGCCTPDVCPAIVKTDYTRFTGTFQYLNKLGIVTGISFPPPFGNFNVDLRNESWQLFDSSQNIAQKFINIVDGYDVTITPKPIFFPTDVTYTAQTSPRQAAYTIDLRLYYNPSSWGRSGQTRFIKFKNCIVTKAPTRNLVKYDNTNQHVNPGVIILAGGAGYEDDGATILTGFGDDGVTPISTQATLENFIHRAAEFSVHPSFVANDGYSFESVEYKFVPHLDTLLSKDLVTLGCEPSLALNKAFINNAFAGDMGIKTQLINGIINSPNFPNPLAAQDCLLTALAALRQNLTPAGVAQFQATSDICLGKLRSDTKSALDQLTAIAVDPCSCTSEVSPSKQFTTKPINIKVDLKEKNGVSLGTGLPLDIADGLASKLKAYPTFGQASQFTYDGYQFFNASISATEPGTGTVMVSFENNIFCTNIIPADNAIDPVHALQTLNYTFIYSPASGITGAGDSDGKPRRDEGDLSRDSNINGGD